MSRGAVHTSVDTVWSKGHQHGAGAKAKSLLEVKDGKTFLGLIAEQVRVCLVVAFCRQKHVLIMIIVCLNAPR
jgi:hypothetical protein